MYLYNEKRGYTYLEELLKAFEKKYPHEHQIIGSIRKHAADEKHHYCLFAEYFAKVGRKPLRVSSWHGYCDQIVQKIFGKTIDQIEPLHLMENDQMFFQLCRLIMITEMRGMQQVAIILNNPLIRRDPELVRIFSIVKKDEPSHCYPYQTWLRKHGQQEATLKEKLADNFVHYSLLFVKLPSLFLGL